MDSVRSNTLKYYNSNAEDYYKDTVNADLSKIYNRFLKYIRVGAHILDVGCGSGRDSKYFLSKGYSVTAIDGSTELCKLAEKNIGQTVSCIAFNEISFNQEFDAIWACASLLHVSELDMNYVIDSLYDGLKTGGFLYASFKYGDGVRIDDKERYYIDLNETSIKTLFQDFNLKEMWISDDVRSQCMDRWINIIVEK